MLVIDGSHGEGGGQVLRTCVTLAALTGRAVRILRIRAGRKEPGLKAQHLAAVAAAARVCAARVEGARPGSDRLEFRPGGPPRAGTYELDVGTAGAATLVVQTVLGLLPAPSTLVVRGGTHVPLSPPFDYLRDVWLPTLGLDAALSVKRTGWYPAGGGELHAVVEGEGPKGPIRADERGALRTVRGRALAANLPAHIPQRMADRARSLLRDAGIEARIDAERTRAACPGAGIFLCARYAGGRAGFDALGKPGKPSEAVAEEAVAALLEHHASGACLDVHLADQLLVPLSLRRGESRFRAQRASRHLETNAWVIAQFGLADIAQDAGPMETVRVTVRPSR